MRFITVWIDRDHARIFQFSDEKMERKVLKATHQNHHTHKLDHNELESKKFFAAVAKELGRDGRVLIVGPGVVSKHFCDYLNQEHSDIAVRVVGCEKVDHPTDNQIAAMATKYFQSPAGNPHHTYSRS